MFRCGSGAMTLQTSKNLVCNKRHLRQRVIKKRPQIQLASIECVFYFSTCRVAKSRKSSLFSCRRAVYPTFFMINPVEIIPRQVWPGSVGNLTSFSSLALSKMGPAPCSNSSSSPPRPRRALGSDGGSGVPSVIVGRFSTVDL